MTEQQLRNLIATLGNIRTLVADSHDDRLIDVPGVLDYCLEQLGKELPQEVK